MTRSLYSKFILGYLIFGLLGFITIATFSSKMTRDYLVRYQADAMYDEANIIASSCSTMYQGKRLDSEEVTSQIRGDLVPSCRGFREHLCEKQLV